MKNYKVGDVVKGTVTGIEDYGIFLSFDDDTTGLIHISEISDSFVRNVSDYAKIGDEIEARIIDYSANDKHLKLSIKEFEDAHVFEKQIHGIVETKSGFDNLKKELPSWIETKENEMSKK